MRHTPRMVRLATAALLAALLMALGCASRKQVTTSEVEPPPPPPSSTEETTTAPPPSSTESDTDTRASALSDAFFDFDEAALRADAKTALENNAKWMEKNSANVIVEGHCDERGSVEYNLALGERRARAAKDFLVSYGIAANRLTTISYGKERPFDPGHDENSWAQNRRAHFVAK